MSCHACRTQVMNEGVATFSGLFLDRSGRNVKLRFALYNFDRSTGDWTDAGIYFDTDFFHVDEGLPAALVLEQVEHPKFRVYGFSSHSAASSISALAKETFLSQ